MDFLENNPWRGEHVLKVREKGEKITLFELQDILLDSKVFLTKDEILYYLLMLREKYMSEVIDIPYVCKSCGHLHTKAQVKFKDLKVQTWGSTKTIEIDNKKILVEEPNRNHICKAQKGTVYYNMEEFSACLNIEGIEDEYEKINWIMGLKVKDFNTLESFYHENRFIFAPKVTFKCANCKAPTNILIDNLPNIRSEWL